MVYRILLSLLIANYSLGLSFLYFNCLTYFVKLKHIYLLYKLRDNFTLEK